MVHIVFYNHLYGNDVPVDVQDGKGDTIIHHMIRRRDYTAINVLLDSLKPNQHFNFAAEIMPKQYIAGIMAHEPIDLTEMMYFMKLLELKGEKLR